MLPTVQLKERAGTEFKTDGNYRRKEWKEKEKEEKEEKEEGSALLRVLKELNLIFFSKVHIHTNLGLGLGFISSHRRKMNSYITTSLSCPCCTQAAHL